MLIALDYDGTYTADAELWDRFIAQARANRHRVFVVTMRFPSEGEEVTRRLVGKADRIIFTSREAKRRHLERLGHAVHVWIDNNPEYILGDAEEVTLQGVSQWAQWKAQCARTFRVIWPEKPMPAEARMATTTQPLPAPASAPTVASAPRPLPKPTLRPEQSNRLVTVHGFKVWSESQGRYRVSRFKAPREILEQYEVDIVEGSAEVVARADLDGRGRYLAPDMERSESSWRSSSFDLQSGLEVTEVGVIPRAQAG